MNNFDPTQLKQRLQAAIKQDPRKAGVLGFLALVLAIMGGRLMLSGGTQPNRAGASIARTSEFSASSSSEEARNRSANDRSGYSDPAKDHTTRPHNSASQLREWLAEPIRPVSRNLFSVKLEYFPSDGGRTKQENRAGSEGEFWSRLEKSLMVQADQRDKRENLLANFRTEAGKLRLDTIMPGPQPKAMIDGKLVAEGDVVASFRVLKIEPRRIIVEREGIKLAIQMK